jgi:hypothetical protein
MSLSEFVAYEEHSPAFTEKWADEFINSLAKERFHVGDCTKMPCPCSLCALERILSDYHEYRFPEKYPSKSSMESEIDRRAKEKVEEWKKGLVKYLTKIYGPFDPNVKDENRCTIELWAMDIIKTIQNNEHEIHN